MQQEYRISAVLTGQLNRSIAGARVDEEGHLVLTLSDGQVLDLGSVRGPAGEVPSELLAAAAAALPRTGGRMEGDLDLGGNALRGLREPRQDTDGATKAYVDANGGMTRKEREKLEFLASAADGTICERRTETAEAYRKIAPEDCLPSAMLDRIGGKTVQQGGRLVSADVTSVDTGVSRVEIPAAIRGLTGYGWSAGEVYNEVDYAAKQYIQRVVRVDMSQLSWNRAGADASLGLYAVAIKDKALGIRNVISDIYSLTDVTSWDANKPDLSICGSAASKTVVVRDTSAASSAELKAKLAGAYLCYELEEPVMTDISDLIPEGFGNLAVEPGGAVTFAQAGGTALAVPFAVTWYIRRSNGGLTPEQEARISNAICFGDTFTEEQQAAIQAMIGIYSSEGVGF